MSTEIKEIFNYKDEIILDYINNLQKQIEEYQKALDETMSEKIDLQEEIERQSKAQVILDDMLAEYKSKIDLQEEENQRLKENNQNMQVEMSRSWERIDKAIELLNNEDIIVKLQEFENKYTVNFYDKKKDLLNILKGE